LRPKLCFGACLADAPELPMSTDEPSVEPPHGAVLVWPGTECVDAAWCVLILLAIVVFFPCSVVQLHLALRA
jgi:hypothetical protein